MTEMPPSIRRLSRFAPLALVVVIAAGCGGDGKGTATPNDPPPPAATTGSDPTPMPPALTGTGTGTSTGTGTGTEGGNPSLKMGSRNLLLLLEGDISHFAPTQVEGKSLEVVALAGPEAFWAGRKTRQRILVKMRVKGGPSLDVKVGQKVDFIGVLTAAGNDPSLGVRNDADMELLAKQGAFVDVSAADVKLR